MNNGINDLPKKYINSIFSLANALSTPIQMPCQIDNTLNWYKSTPQYWERISNSIQETIRNSNWRPVYAVMRPTFTAGTNLLIGGILFDNGRKVYLTPFNATSAVIYDAINDTISTPPGTYGGSANFLGGCLLANGDIFIAPRSSATARIYSPSTGQIRTPGGTFPGTATALTACVAFDNGTQVYCLASFSTTARIWDSRTETVRTPTGTFGGSASTSAGCLLPDGRILIAPQADTTIKIYDWQKDTIFTSSIAISSGAYFGARLTPSGDEVWLSPYNSTTGLLYNWRRDTGRVTSGTFPGMSAHLGVVLAPDGSFISIPGFSGQTRQYQPITDTLKILDGSYTINVFDVGDATILYDGRLMLYPRNMTTAKSYGIKQSPSFNENIILSPFFNRR